MRLGVEEAAATASLKPERLLAAEAGEGTITLRQAETLARTYGRDLAFLFRSKPPEEPAQQQVFRRLPGAPEPPWPAEMQKLARLVSRRQEAVVELRDSLGEESRWRQVLARLSVDAHLLPGILRTELGVMAVDQTAWRDPDGYAPLRAWREAVEAAGILVMQNGDLPVSAMRGFAALHESAPVIVLNSKDDARSRAFTLIHEIGHLWLEEYEVEVEDPEEWCEQVAGQVIMPDHWVARALEASHSRPGSAGQVDEIALLFGVTPKAAAVRMRRLDAIGETDFTAVLREISRRPDKKEAGGSYYLNKITWLGPSYIRLVLDAVDEQALTLSNAAGLLGARVSHFRKLRELADERSAA